MTDGMMKGYAEVLVPILRLAIADSQELEGKYAYP